MAKFVKKSDVVEVFRFEGKEEIPEWVSEAVENKIISTEFVQKGKYIKKPILIIKTQKRGLWRGELDDYIIRNSHGEINSCSFELFDNIYQRVEYATTIENTRNYAENIEEGHKHINEEKNEESKLELSAKLELDTTDFEENIRSVTKEIETFNEVVYRLEENLNRVFGKEKLNEIKTKIESPKKQLSDEDLEYIKEIASKDIKARFAKEGKIKIDY
ncbi:hypothetical protein O0889_01070 [Clostridioides difficile]|nr:hypothetical protein [Clostridioides difficile]MDI6389312.1 hypothetical protein [Clostridioides difficile]